MENRNQGHLENWAISPLAGQDREEITAQPPLFKRMLVASGFGIIMGMLLNLAAESPAHATFTENDSLMDAAVYSVAQNEAVEETGIDTESVVLGSLEEEDYRTRIPAWDKPRRKYQHLSVSATAYNNVPAQTDNTPDIAAWGDRIKPGMPIIAVSRDLLKMGLTRGSVVRVSGLEGEFVVLDKMNKRYRKRIDIYMGKDLRAARQFGLKSVTLSWDTDQTPLSSVLVASNR